VRFVRLEIKLSHFSTRGNHLIRYNIAVNIERGSDIRVAHHLLLYGHGSAHSIKP